MISSDMPNTLVTPVGDGIILSLISQKFVGVVLFLFQFLLTYNPAREMGRSCR